jgi:mono/diheme cytochrome c family protein
LARGLSLTAVLLGIAGAAGTALALGAGRPPRPENPAFDKVRSLAKDPGRRLFRDRQCVTCHGEEGEGGAMGPGLGTVMPEYLAAAGGDREEAKRRLIAYIVDPRSVPPLRRDGVRYPNPMPRLGPATDAELRSLAEFVLGIKPLRANAGGDGTTR